jgi:predicted small secreted protein
MRRWRATAIAVALIAAALTGCATPAGVDGDLGDDWRPMAQARQFAPKAGECHLTSDPTSPLNYQPVDCAQPHRLETIHVGTLTGALADRPIPPPFHSAVMRPVFTDCDARAREFVGDDWRNGRLSVQAAPPSPESWRAGSRWYRCDIFEVSEHSSVNGSRDAVMSRAGTLRGALARSSALAHRCFNEYERDSLESAACGRPHRYEFVGIWTAPDGRYGAVHEDANTVFARCRVLVARFVGLPVNAGDLRNRTGTYYTLPSEDAWIRGDRGIRCFLWSDNRELTRSLKGAGPKALPPR